MKIKLTILTLVLIFRCISISAQNSDILTNTKVIEMVKAGFSEQIVVAKINKSLCAFNLELDSMLLLKKNGITDGMLSAMLSAKTVSVADLNSDDPNVMHHSGIYYYNSLAKPGEIVKRLDANAISERKAAGVAIYGIPLSSSSVAVDGSQSRFVIKGNYPVFFFYFDTPSDNEGIQNAGFANYHASSPNEFSIISFTSSQSSNNRTVQTSSGIGFTEASGISSKNKIPFEYIKISDGIYKVFLSKPLKGGEYAFIFSGTNGFDNKLFDFSTVSKQKQKSDEDLW